MRRSERVKRKVEDCLQTDATNDKKSKINDLLLNDNQLNPITIQRSPYFQSNDKISEDFFQNKSCIELSKALLGQILCRRLSMNGPILKGRIVETEAYLGVEDKACHTYGGRRTESCEPMYMKAGTCYVYFTYGMYYCMNLSSEGEGSAVLLRAIQPIKGIDSMQTLRAESRKGKNPNNCRQYKLKMLANGPSKLCMAFDINKNNMNKVDITNSQYIWLESGGTVPSDDIICSKRIGIPNHGEWTDKLLRFYIKGSEFVSFK